MKKDELKAVFDRADLRYAEYGLGGGWTILVLERGGRIIGPFSKKFEAGLFWTSAILKDTKKFEKFLKDEEWNIGGDRVWIAPEIQYSITDRTRFWETLKTPVQIDPGNYRMECNGQSIKLKQQLSLQAHVIASGTTDLRMERTIQAAANPLRTRLDDQNIMEQVQFVGYEQLMELETGDRSDAAAECWNLLQVVPQGEVFIPVYHSAPGVDYYEPAGEMERIEERMIRLRATGDRRYKVGYKAVNVTGRIGYLTKWLDSDCLLVRNFPNNPSAHYAEEPPLREGERGFSVHVYNDDGNSGGFTELECNLQSVGGGTGYSRSMDRVSTWIYLGEQAKLRKIARCLLGGEE